jgi:hypothetical protein
MVEYDYIDMLSSLASLASADYDVDLPHHVLQRYFLFGW